MSENIFDINWKKFNLDWKSLEKTEIENLKSLTQKDLFSLDQATRLQFVKKLDAEIDAWKDRKINFRTASNIQQLDNLLSDVKRMSFWNWVKNKPAEKQNSKTFSLDYVKDIKNIVLKNKNNREKLQQIFDQNLQKAKEIFSKAGFNFPELSNNDLNSEQNFWKTIDEVMESKVWAVVEGLKYLLACNVINPWYSYNSSSIEWITKRYINFLVIISASKNPNQNPFYFFKAMGLKDKDILTQFWNIINWYIDIKDISDQKFENLKAFWKNFDFTSYQADVKKYLHLLEWYKQPTLDETQVSNNLPWYIPAPGFDPNQ